MNYLSIELRKTKRRGIWLVMAVLLAVSLAWIFDTVDSHPELNFGWKMMSYYMPLLNAIMIPTAISVFTSRIIDMEHKGSTWKMLETVQSKKSLYLAKVLYGFCGIFIFSSLELIGLFIIGKICRFEGAPDLWAYALLFSQTLIISFNLFLLQMIISLVFSNQAAAICTGLCGSMAGLFLMFIPQMSLLRCIIPWGHYGASMFVGMDYSEEKRKVLGFYYMNQHNGAVFFVIGWLFLLIVGGWILFKNMDTDGYNLKDVLCKSNKGNTTPKRHASRFSDILHMRCFAPEFRHAHKGGTRVIIPHTPTELIKIRRTPIWLAFIILPLISSVIGTANYINNIEILKSAWYSLWTQHSLFFCYIFMPPLIGVYASYLWRLEHSGTNWNMANTLIPPYILVFQKVAVCALVSFFTIIWLGILFIACGLYAGIDAPIPLELAHWLFFGFIGSVCVCMAQCFLSLAIKSFAVPIGIALLGGIAGLAATAQGFAYSLPYSLLSIGLRANNPNRALDLSAFLTSSAVFIIVFYGLSVCVIKVRK